MTRIRVFHGRVGMLLAVLGILMGGPLAASTEPLQYQPQVIAIDGAQYQVQVPAGYVLEALITGLDRPRLMTFASNGDLFIGSIGGKVYRVPPPYTQAQVLIELPSFPHSVAFRPGEILIAQTDGVYRAPYQPGQAQLAPGDLTLLAPLPPGGGHSSRTVRVGPDGRVYASLGNAGNCNNEYVGEQYPFDARRGGILVLIEQPGAAPQWQAYASGLRNPVGFDWHPATQVMYATNNGPDHWGFDLPPEYFARIEPGAFFGMPWFQFAGQQIQRDPCITTDPPQSIENVRIPIATFTARSAPMGMAFVPEGALDPRLVHDAIVAIHGSWATLPEGGPSGDPASKRPPAVVAVRFANGEAACCVTDVATGFQLPDGSRWARPVGVAFGPDGALYFTSDEGVQGVFRLRLAAP